MSLKAMMERQKAKQQAESSAPAAAPSEGATTTATTPPVAESAKPKLNFLAKKPASPAAPAATPVVPAPPASTPSVVESKAIGGGTLLTLDDIADDESTVPNINSMEGSGFADEIPATAPTRELPADLEAGQKAFVQQLDSIYEILHDPELFGQMIRTIMQELQDCPDYIKLMADQDVHTMIRGLRSSMGLAKIKKAEKATKSRATKKSPAPAAMATTLDEMFNSEDW